MTDEFLTNGLQNNRYLKALRLIDQFETEIEATLRELDQRMVNAQSDLFESSTDPEFETIRQEGNPLASHRVDHEMTGPQALERDSTLQLNIHLYWVTPTEYNRGNVDGALRAFGYKIENADQDIDARVVEKTRANDWSVETSGNPYDSNSVFYRHVSSMAEIEEAADTLVRHFSEFGDEYASSPERNI